jgi:hypothetical protein
MDWIVMDTSRKGNNNEVIEDEVEFTDEQTGEIDEQDNEAGEDYARIS